MTTKEILNEILDVVADVSEMPNEEYALLRRYSFGASDSSILCNVNPFQDINKLILQKQTPFITDDEKAIGDKASVRMGRDLEPMVLQKFEEETGIRFIKPTEMFRIKEAPYLTVNFDGVSDTLIPIEAKIVTKYGEKYYNKKSTGLGEIDNIPALNDGEYIKEMSTRAGIPPYYYTQLQQQIYALDAEYGYLAVIFVDSWEFKIYRIVRDSRTITTILKAADYNKEYLPTKEKQD